MNLAFLSAGIMVWLLTAWLSLGVTIDQRDYQQPVEQQTLGGATQSDQSLWVMNPFVPGNSSDPCFWDADDSQEMSWRGSLAVGEIWTYDQCIILDDTSHALGIQAVSKGVHDLFEVRIGVVSPIKGTASWRAGSVEFPRNGPRKQWARLCAISPEYDVSEVGGLPAIPNPWNSMVGHGDKARIVWGIANLGARPVRELGVILEVEPEAGLISWCQ